MTVIHNFTGHPRFLDWDVRCSGSGLVNGMHVESYREKVEELMHIIRKAD